MKGTFEIEMSYEDLEDYVRLKILANHVRHGEGHYIDRDDCLEILGEPKRDELPFPDVPATDDDIDWTEGK